MILTQEYSRIADSSTRAWLISPEGEVHNCGMYHFEYVKNHPEEFGTEYIDDLLEEGGWIQLGVIEGTFHVNFHGMANSKTFDLVKTFAKNIQDRFERVDIFTMHLISFTKEEFFRATLKDVNRRGVSHYGNRKQAALPHSRNLLQHTDLEELSYPLRKAFSLLGLEDKYKKMSLNQIASKLREHETLLEDETGWTSDELIRDINQILEQFMHKDIKIVIVAITDEAGNLLMIRRVKGEDDGNGGKWEFPAGHIDPGEIPAVAATREVKEETGLDIFLLPHGIIIPTKKGKAAYYLGFVQGGKSKPEVKLAPDEHDKYLWVKAKDFDKVKPTHKHMKENLVDLLTHVSEKLEVPEKVAQRLIAAHDYWSLARRYEKLRRAASLSHTTPLRQRKGNIMKRQRRIQAQENTPSTNVFTLPGPGEELKEAILVGDEVEIFLKSHMNGGGETPEPSISGIVERRDRNTVWVRSPEDDEEQLIPVNWNDRGDWAFVRVYRSPDQVVHYINGNPYDKDSKEVSKAKGLGLILESEPPTRYESVWALMRGETPDLDRSMGQAPESMDVVAPTNKPKPGTPDILTQVKDVVRSHGLEPDVVDHLGKGRVLILTQDGDLKKELIRVLEKNGKKVDASLQGRLIVREGASLSTMGTTTVPIATDDDLMLLTRKKRERDLRDQKNQERGKESARKIRSQGVQTAPQGVPLTPGQALQNQQNPQNQQTVVSPSNAGMVINPAQQQVRDFTSFYGMMPKVPMPGGGIMLKPNQTQQRKMVQDQAKDKNPMHTNPKASRSQIRQVAASLARSLRDQEYDDSNHYISELRAMGVKESSIVRSSIGSKRAWGHLHRYLEAAGEIENSRIARTAARLAPDL